MVDGVPIDWPTIRNLAARGVPWSTLVAMSQIRMMRGRRGRDGCLDLAADGELFLAFYEAIPDDLVLWSPSTGQLATWRGRAAVLGEDNVVNAGTYAFDNSLHVVTSGLEWLRDEGRGVVVLDWSRCFERLRNADRIAVDESLLATYRQHMRPRLPILSVLTSNRLRVAA